MKISAPKKNTWWIGCILLVLGVVAFILPFVGVTMLPGWLDKLFFFASSLLYTLATAMKGL
ncbi:MAG: hypothetical protein JW984_17005 [Deltaproteobacteria bacterium]|uniref:Uncharacterized protein n=1 Tax=Candidatus Zymogenus saltonus TaxID=2844893 RepID=A0A9D8KID4_9DELT|nr:hypothetical protein [Candidatus Zymogenus saltonus]